MLLPKTVAAIWAITVGCWSPVKPMRSALFSVMWTSSRNARNVTPANIVTAMPPISASVVAAFFDFGLRNAGTPLLIASTPVSAVQPEANARSPRKTMPSVPSCPARFDLVRARCGHQLRPCQQPEHAYHDHADDAEDEGVRRDGEGDAALAQASQVEQDDNRDDPECRLAPDVGRAPPAAASRRGSPLPRRPRPPP